MSISVFVFVQVGGDITKCEAPSIEGASRKNEWKKLKLLHRVVHLARLTVGQSNCKGVLTRARSGSHRHANNKWSTSVVEDTDSRARFITGDFRLAVEPAASDGQRDRLTNYRKSVRLGGKEPARRRLRCGCGRQSCRCARQSCRCRCRSAATTATAAARSGRSRGWADLVTVAKPKYTGLAAYTS